MKPIIHPVFVRYPPAGMDHEYVVKHDLVGYVHELDQDDAFLVWRDATKRFVEEGDPLAAMGICVWAHRAGVYPPEWALDFLADRFSKYMTLGDKRTLDQLMGLKGARGVPPIRKKKKREQFEQDMILAMVQLRMALRLSIEEAARRVALWCERNAESLNANELDDYNLDP